MKTETGNRNAEPFDQAQGRRGTRKMEKFVGLLALCCALLFSGCASMSGGDPVRVEPTPGGATVGVNPLGLADGWAWVCANPWKTLGGIGAGAGLYVYGDHNKWWGSPGDDSNNGSGNQQTTTTTETKTDTKTDTRNQTSTYSADTRVTTGDNSPVIINIYQNSAITTAPATP